MVGFGENSDAVSMEPISPELALVDPELGARARAALPVRTSAPRPVPMPRPAPPVSEAREHRSYPLWARVTAAMWLVVLGILIGGAAIPHAQDTPRVVPKDEDARFCEAPPKQIAPSKPPSRPGA
jgi:hypothetical protein